MKIYAVYKGDDLLSMGTVRECAKELKVKEGTILYYRTPTYKRRTSESKGRRLVDIDD